MERYGWSWDYLLWGIPYAIVERLLADAATVNYSSSEKDGKKKEKLTKQNKEQVMQYINEQAAKQM